MEWKVLIDMQFINLINISHLELVSVNSFSRDFVNERINKLTETGHFFPMRVRDVDTNLEKFLKYLEARNIFYEIYIMEYYSRVFAMTEIGLGIAYGGDSNNIIIGRDLYTMRMYEYIQYNLSKRS